MRSFPLFAASAFAVVFAFSGLQAEETGPKFPEADAELVPEELFVVPEGLEVTVWASSPQFYNPTNIDIDKDGRIWVAEGVRYRCHFERQPEGDRIVVLEDTDGDGTADSSHTFVQEPLLVAPLGVAVIDNQIVVSQPPHLLVYTDVDRDLKFDPETDKREVLLTGFNGQNHDHSLHSVTVGPDGKWYFNQGNCGAKFTDKSGKTFSIF
ncbi:MAG: PVC-type heme-binding CxxCH protein, partial [Verrucomicrobiota bacterium]